MPAGFEAPVPVPAMLVPNEFLPAAFVPAVLVSRTLVVRLLRPLQRRAGRRRGLGPRLTCLAWRTWLTGRAGFPAPATAATAATAAPFAALLLTLLGITLLRVALFRLTGPGCTRCCGSGVGRAPGGSGRCRGLAAGRNHRFRDRDAARLWLVHGPDNDAH